MSTILIIDDEEVIRFTFATLLEDAGHRVSTAASRTEALKRLDRENYDLVFLDILLGSDSGTELLGEIRVRFPDCPVIMITGAPEVATATEALRLGAYDYVSKPIDRDGLLRVTRQALQQRELLVQRERYRKHLELIFRSVPEALLLVDRTLKVLEANVAAAVLLEQPGGLVGATLTALPAGQPFRFGELLGKVLIDERMLRNQRIEYRDGTGQARVVILSVVPWADERHGEQGALIVLRDDTRIEGLERSLKKRRQFEHIIGQSTPMQAVFELIENLAEVDTTVLITGPSGTGKELVAEALHCRGPRRDGPLVKVNCAALPENLLESELFGHVKGSFTGAVKDKAGRFQVAHRGTIFLDEIGDITPALQVRLLRVLQEKQIERVGGNLPIPVDVRIVAATNQPLLEKVQRGEFREDLYYRLRVVEIPLPPLRERRADIPLLVEHFIGHFNVRFKRSIEDVTADALALLTGYSWPGNIRELQHAIEHAFVVCRDRLIGVEHLPKELRQMAPLAEEPARIAAALERAAGNKTLAAQLLGISRRTIYRKIEEYNLPLPTIASGQ